MRKRDRVAKKQYRREHPQAKYPNAELWMGDARWRRIARVRVKNHSRWAIRLTPVMVDRMMQAREANTEHIEVMKHEAEIEADRERRGGKMTIDELVYKTLHEFD